LLRPGLPGRRRTPSFSQRVDISPGHSHIRVQSVDLLVHRRTTSTESRFLFWESAHSIVKEFGLGHRSLLYRHASATGLLHQRRENFTSVLDSIVEQCESAPVTAASILRAIRAYSCLKAHGRWVDPPKRRAVSQVTKSSSAPRISNRDTAIKKSRKPMKTNAARKF
jgi:hypothetical protein